MDAAEWAVLAGAAAAIAWVNWYFFVAGRARTDDTERTHG